MHKPCGFIHSSRIFLSLFSDKIRKSDAASKLYFRYLSSRQFTQAVQGLPEILQFPLQLPGFAPLRPRIIVKPDDPG